MAPARTVRKTSKKKKDKSINVPVSSGMVLELDGAVYIVERDKNGKEISRVEIPGTSVLNAVLYILKSMIHNKP